MKTNSLALGVSSWLGLDNTWRYIHHQQMVGGELVVRRTKNPNMYDDEVLLNHIWCGVNIIIYQMPNKAISDMHDLVANSLEHVY